MEEILKELENSHFELNYLVEEKIIKNGALYDELRCELQLHLEYYKDIINKLDFQIKLNEIEKLK